jgi:hypothetical protein
MTQPTPDSPEKDPGPLVRTVRTVVIVIGAAILSVPAAISQVPENAQDEVVAIVGIMGFAVAVVTGGLNAFEAITGRRITGQRG